MTKLRIDKQDIDGFLAELLKDHLMFAPAKEADYVAFRQVQSPDEVVWDCLVTRRPAKEFLFPQTEPLFIYTKDKTGLRLRSLEEVDQERVIWGMRPCDARAMAVQSTVFDTGEDPDVYFINRRARTTLVGIGCNEPLQTCFCTEVGGGPFSKEGLDLLLTDVGDAFIVDVLTEKGRALMEHGGFQAASKADEKAAREAEALSREKLPAPISLDQIRENLDRLTASPYWDEVQESCLGCGICTFLCPVCHCFDIVDEGSATCGQRVRNWDTCQYCIYSLEASGHNPRPSGRERTRQRLMHKFDYQLVNQDVVGCVGCGRCVMLCPVNLDIRQILAEIGAAP